MSDNNKEVYEPYGLLAIELPPDPPCYTGMKARLTGQVPGTELTVVFPVYESLFRNFRLLKHSKSLNYH